MNSARQIYWIAFVSVTNTENASTPNAGRTTRRVYDDAGNLIETHAHKGDSKEQ
jgi:YD repeat-containing protein